MPFTKNLNLKDINPEWSEKRSGYRKLDEVPIRFVHVVSSYDAEPENSNSFFVVPQSLFNSRSENYQERKQESRISDGKKNYMKESQVK